jgi:hypothetical protein
VVGVGVVWAAALAGGKWSMDGATIVIIAFFWGRLSKGRSQMPVARGPVDGRERAYPSSLSNAPSSPARQLASLTGLVGAVRYETQRVAGTWC